MQDNKFGNSILFFVKVIILVVQQIYLFLEIKNCILVEWKPHGHSFCQTNESKSPKSNAIFGKYDDTIFFRKRF